MPYDPDVMDHFKEQYEALKPAARYVEDVSDATLLDVFTDSFMREWTRFRSRDQFFSYAGWDVETPEDLSAVPEDEFESYVTRYTVFDDREKMLNKAGEEWVVQKLGF